MPLARYARLPRRAADLGRARPPTTATAGWPACATSRSSPARSSSRCRSSSRPRRSRTTSRCRSRTARTCSGAAARRSSSPTWGEVIAGPLYDEEGIVIADCDLRAGLHAKRWFDAVGHYSREDVASAHELARVCAGRPRNELRPTTTARAGFRTASTRAGSPTASTRVPLSARSIDADDRAFIERMDMFFLATADADGRPQCSYKGGEPGLRARARRAHGRVPELRRQRDVPVDGQRAREPARRDAVHRLHRRSGRRDCGSTASRASTSTTSCSAATRARSSSCACARRRCSPTARATSTGWRWSSARGSCRAQATRPPVPDWKRTDWACDVLPAGDPARRQTDEPPGNG